MIKEHWYIILAGILSGFYVFGAAVFVRLGLSLYQILLFPALLATLALLPLILLKKKYRPKKNMLGLYAVLGFVAFIVGVSEFGPIILGVPVAITILLIYTQPLWTALFSKLFLKERITKYKATAIVLVILGAAVLVNPFTLQNIGSLPGVIIAATGGVTLSVWLIIGRVAGIKKYNPITTQFSYTLFFIICVLLSYPLAKVLIKDTTINALSFSLPSSTWLYLLLFAIFIVVISRILYFKGVHKITASSAGVILLLEPVIAAILATLFLKQSLTLNILVGGALILIANYLVVQEK